MVLAPGMILQDIPELAPVIVTMNLGVLPQPGLKLRYAIPRGTEDRCNQRLVPPTPDPNSQPLSEVMGPYPDELALAHGNLAGSLHTRPQGVAGLQ